MGLRFRKSFPLGSLFRINLSKSGVSLGVGPRGLNVNFGPRGVRSTVGLPGTGIYYQDTESWKRLAPDASATTDGNSANANASQVGVPWFWVVIAIVGALWLARACSAPPSSSDHSVTSSTSGSAAATHSASAPVVPATTVRGKDEDRALTGGEVKELQSLLARSGYAPGPVDGVLGPRTRAAVQAFRKRSADPATGDPTLATLDRLRVVKH